MDSSDYNMQCCCPLHAEIPCNSPLRNVPKLFVHTVVSLSLPGVESFKEAPFIPNHELSPVFNKSVFEHSTTFFCCSCPNFEHNISDANHCIVFTFYTIFQLFWNMGCFKDCISHVSLSTLSITATASSWLA